MRRGTVDLLAPVGVFLCFTTLPLDSIYIGVESRRVPVARLVTNLERQLATNPKDAELHIKLARLYGMAFALNGENLPVVEGRGGNEEVWFGHEPNLVPHRVESAGKSRPEAARAYLKKAAEHYRAAVALDPTSLLARLGLGWTLEQSGNKTEAIAAYRAVIGQAWPREQSAKFAELGQRFYTVEAAEYLIPLLDPKADADEIAELRRRAELLRSVPRPITPLAVPLTDDATISTIVDLGAEVRFDADGSGRRDRWTWITPDAGWLVYDADGAGQITSALQWFGNVSFWLMWTSGYHALGALDDDMDGELKGRELRYLAIWRDGNRNGTSEPGEVRPLDRYGIVALSCRSTPGDNRLLAAKADAGVSFENGRVRPTYDVILRRSWSVSAPAPD